MRAQRDEIRLRSILASPPRTMRSEVTSPKRLPGGGAQADGAPGPEPQTPPPPGRSAQTTAPRAWSATPPSSGRLSTASTAPRAWSAMVDPAGLEPTTAAV